MVAIRASIHTEESTDKRRHPRHTLCLSADTWSMEGGSNGGTIYDVSRSGMLLDCTLELPVGDELLVELPYVGQVPAKVVWREGSVTGCEFSNPISLATVSACLLRAEPELQGPPTYLKDVANAFDRANTPRAVGTWETIVVLGVPIVAVAILIAGSMLL